MRYRVSKHKSKAKGYLQNKPYLKNPSGQSPIANPSFNGSTGEEQPPPRGRGPRGRKKAQTSMFAFFSLTGRRPAGLAPKPPQRGVISLPGLSSFRKPIVLRPTVNKVLGSSLFPFVVRHIHPLNHPASYVGPVAKNASNRFPSRFFMPLLSPADTRAAYGSPVTEKQVINFPLFHKA
jgi:hypothetical protein